MIAVLVGANVGGIAQQIIEKRHVYVQLTCVGIAVHDWEERRF
ncbi:MAG: hypothetical protein ACUVX8_04960 [Candidatus Zipacnadales bacterium]